MNICKIENGKSFFIVGVEIISPNELDRGHLLKLLTNIYDLDETENVVFPEEIQIDTIINPVEKEILNIIVQKIKEFNDNKAYIKDQIISQFPDLN